MKVSGFSIVKNAIKYNYPVKEAILSILPICDEFIVNVGDSEDNTLDLIKSIKSPRLKIFERRWDMSKGERIITEETNFALSQCSGDWAFYIQSDEVVHEKDLPVLKRLMKKYLTDDWIDGFRFRWFHFYGSYYRYRIDAGWFQKQDRIVRNNGTIEANSGAWGFQKKDKSELNTVKSPCYIYHYGWVNEPKALELKIKNAQKLGYAALNNGREKGTYNLKEIDKFPVYFGTHPKVMHNRVKTHNLSRQDWQNIKRRYFWNPLLWLRIRYKTPKRVKAALPK